MEHLAWTLLHFLWQGLSIAFVYAAARRLVRARYVLACAALAAMLAAPLVTWVAIGSHRTTPPVVARIEAPPATDSAGSIALPRFVAAATPLQQPQFLFWVVAVWLAGAVVFGVRLAGGWIIAARLRTTMVRPAPPEWQEALRRLAASIGLSRPVRLLVSALVEAPVVVGWLRPVVLVPVAALGGLPAAHLEALLLHELAHIRRHDYVVNILQNIAEALLFYHPAVWWVSGHIRAERELCCDDVAVTVTGDALTYARALAQMESWRPAHTGAAMAARGGSLAARIARVLGHPRPAMRGGIGPGVLAIAILLAAAAYGLFAQSGPAPAFQVASVKRNAANWSEPTHHPMGVSARPGGRLTAANASVMLLIQFAYAPHDSPHWLPLPASQIVGGPAWISTPGYDIEAKAEPGTDRKHLWLMLQTLLADRFQLKLHRETRQLPVYELTAAKSGPRLPPAKPADCVAQPSEGPPRTPGKVDCGYVSGPFQGYGKGLQIEGRKVQVADLIRELSSVLGRPVLDRTGFTGDFDLHLTFTPSDALLGFPGFGGPGDPGGARLPSDPNLPDVFAALEEQLGLKLVQGKGPVDVLVVDRVERPTAN
jgi:uncharacterized protein (TIGR03435 family)